MTYILYLLVAGFATILTRFLPYFLLKEKSDLPLLLYLQKTSGLLIMVVLCVYAFNTLEFRGFTSISLAFICLILGLLLQIWRRNSLLSIAIPTILYIVLKSQNLA